MHLFILLVIFVGFASLYRLVISKEKKIMLDLTKLVDEVDAITAIIPGIASDYAQLKAEIEALSAQIDPAAQGKIDAIVGKLDAGFSALKQLDDSVVPPAPPAV